MNVMLPLGIDSFEKLRDDGFYYVDKSYFIKDLLNRRFEANLITRPRRFGKTLTMSMLADFFDIRRNSKKHFEGLRISKDAELCRKWQNQWPVIFLTMKSAEGLDFKTAYERLLFRQQNYLLSDNRLSASDIENFISIKNRTASIATLTDSLVLLTRMMAAHFAKPVILLMDEYDVPLAKVSENGYYPEMLDVIRTLLGGAIKTNPCLKFAVVTGCLRISKESIFTITNNFVTDAVSEDSFNESIGFTNAEVEQLLADAGLSEHAEKIRKWYDGYRFGKTDVYCPWDVLNHVNSKFETLLAGGVLSRLSKKILPTICWLQPKRASGASFI